MRQPQNAAALTQSSYLNSLFRRKAFSWTATMTDLETVLPEGVQVLSLDPAIMKNGEVVIHLRVTARATGRLRWCRTLKSPGTLLRPALWVRRWRRLRTKITAFNRSRLLLR